MPDCVCRQACLIICNNKLFLIALKSSVFFGYKYLDYNYDDGKKGFDHYGYDATQQGPLVGLNFHW